MRGVNDKDYSFNTPEIELGKTGFEDAKKKAIADVTKNIDLTFDTTGKADKTGNEVRELADSEFTEAFNKLSDDEKAKIDGIVKNTNMTREEAQGFMKTAYNKFTNGAKNVLLTLIGQKSDKTVKNLEQNARATLYADTNGVGLYFSGVDPLSYSDGQGSQAAVNVAKQTRELYKLSTAGDVNPQTETKSEGDKPPVQTESKPEPEVKPQPEVKPETQSEVKPETEVKPKESTIEQPPKVESKPVETPPEPPSTDKPKDANENSFQSSIGKKIKLSDKQKNALADVQKYISNNGIKNGDGSDLVLNDDMIKDIQTFIKDNQGKNITRNQIGNIINRHTNMLKDVKDGTYNNFGNNPVGQLNRLSGQILDIRKILEE